MSAFLRLTVMCDRCFATRWTPYRSKEKARAYVDRKLGWVNVGKKDYCPSCKAAVDDPKP
jgi:hypothetical protein